MIKTVPTIDYIIYIEGWCSDKYGRSFVDNAVCNIDDSSNLIVCGYYTLSLLHGISRY